jgi:hypothetical protein
VAPIQYRGGFVHPQWAGTRALPVWSVEGDPRAEIVGHVLESVCDPGGADTDVAGGYGGHAVFDAIRGRAAGDEVQLVTIVRQLRTAGWPPSTNISAERPAGDCRRRASDRVTGSGV